MISCATDSEAGGNKLLDLSIPLPLALANETLSNKNNFGL